MKVKLETMNENLAKLTRDVEILKEVILTRDDEGELSDWAKQELEESRNIPESECVSHEEVKKMVLKDELSN